MQDKAEDEGNTVCIDKDDNEILREFNRRQYVTFRCYGPLSLLWQYLFYIQFIFSLFICVPEV